MLSSVAALGLAFVSLIVAILTFMLGGPDNRTLRVAAGVIILSIGFIFFLIGLFPFFQTSTPGNGGITSPPVNMLPDTPSEAARKWGGQPSSWEKLSNTGWKLRGSLTLSVEEGWRIDYMDANGNVKSCSDKYEPGVYGPVSVSVVEATLWYVPGETKCPSWTIWGQSHP